MSKIAIWICPKTGALRWFLADVSHKSHGRDLKRFIFSPAREVGEGVHHVASCVIITRLWFIVSIPSSFILIKKKRCLIFVTFMKRTI